MQPLGGRRVIPALGMLVGALTGGVLFRLVALAAPLWLAAVLLVACATGAYLAARRPQLQAWRWPL
jgi:predicted MFS family arabinose efflux permease